MEKKAASTPRLSMAPPDMPAPGAPPRKADEPTRSPRSPRSSPRGTVPTQQSPRIAVGSARVSSPRTEAASPLAKRFTEGVAATGSRLNVVASPSDTPLIVASPESTRGGKLLSNEELKRIGAQYGVDFRHVSVAPLDDKSKEHLLSAVAAQTDAGRASLSKPLPVAPDDEGESPPPLPDNKAKPLLPRPEVLTHDPEEVVVLPGKQESRASLSLSLSPLF
jgi:hypothetical protein